MTQDQSPRAGDGKTMDARDFFERWALHTPPDQRTNWEIWSAAWTCALSWTAQTPAPAEERRQLQHLVDDIVEEADQDGHTYYRVRDGADVLFSNMVGACARLLAQPVPIQLMTAEEARADRAHAEAYYRQAEKLLTANEQTLHAEVQSLRAAMKQIDAALQGTLANATDMRDMAQDVDAAQQIARLALAAAPAAAPDLIPGFSPMCLAPLDGTPVMLYMPTTGDKFAVGRWHGSPDSLHGNWGDDEGSYYVHEPVCFMALSNLERLVQPSFKAAVQAPATVSGGADHG